MPLRGRNRATVPSVQVPLGVRRCGACPQAGTPLGTQVTRSAGEAAGDHVLSQAGRDGDQPVGVADGRPLDERIDPVGAAARRIAAGRAVDVIDMRHAGPAGGQAADERGPRRVRVNKVVAFASTKPRDPLDDAEVESAAHRHFDERRVLRFAGRRETARLDAHEADLAAESRQLAGQQILHALGAGVVLAVDDVQDAERIKRSNVCRRGDCGARRRDRDRRGEREGVEIGEGRGHVHPIHSVAIGAGASGFLACLADLDSTANCAAARAGGVV